MKQIPFALLIISTCSLLVMAAGCSPNKPIYFNEPAGLSYYLDQATQVDYPDAEIPSLDEVTQAHQPMTVIDPDFTSFEDITLESAVHKALLNSKLIRGYGTPGLQDTRVNPGQDNLTINPNAAATTWDVAIRESEPGFISQPGAIGSPSNILTNTALDTNQGVEAALADFDAQYTSSFNLATSDEPRNGTSILNSEVFTQTQFSWQNEFSKKSANGTQLFFRNINQYTENNNPLVAAGGIQILDSFYRTSMEAEIRQPLLRGRGAFIQRMPVVISRISTDQELTVVEANLQNMVTNVEIRYWDLYLAYRNFDASKRGLKAALETYRIVKQQYEKEEVDIQKYNQAIDQYQFFDRQVITAYNSLLNAEGQLRFLLGWAATDGRMLRPIDEPVTTPIEFDWCTTMCEALTYRPSIRRQRWEIKKRELALQYSKNGLLPELNLSLVYRWLGLGNKYGVSAGDDQPFPDVNSGALNELLGGDYQELAFGGTFAMPIGFRREEANVRNAELKLAREIGRGEDLELDVNKELSETFRALAANQYVMQSAFNSWIATDKEVTHWERVKEAGLEALNINLDSQRRRAQAEIAFYTALVEYNKCIALMHRRKGTILAYSGIQFGEGPWPGKAYIDAEEHARRRSASRQINYGWTRPQVISRGEDYAPATNTGQVAPAYQIPASGNPIISDSPVMTGPYEMPPQNIPMQGPVERMPYIESHASPMIDQPTLADPANYHSAANQTSEAAIQQVAYHEPVAAPNNAATPARTVEPVAIRIQAEPAPKSSRPSVSTSIQPSEPKRDHADQPVQRLKAKTPTAGSATSANTAVQAPVASNLQWEKLGLSKPQSQPAKTTARIKTN